MPVANTYTASCWNCLSEFDALSAVWCSHDPKNPTKLCPFCFRCFCEANEKYKIEFWKHAPQQLVDELQTLTRSQDRLGDLLIRTRKITTPQLLQALVEQKNTGRRLGEILVSSGFVKQSELEAALVSQGVNPLRDTHGVAYAAKPVWEQSSPEAILQYILSLAARKGASDVLIEPKETEIQVRYRIDGFSFRLDPIPKAFQSALTQKLAATFNLAPGRESRPQTSRSGGHFGENDFDLILQTLPGPHGISATIKLVNRDTFIKDFTVLGMEIEDRVRLMEELKGGFGLVLVTSPAYNGFITTSYALMSFLVQSQSDVLSLEAPIYWVMEGARQVEIEPGPEGLRVEQTLRSLMAVRPDVIMLSAMPDRGTAQLAAQLASSLLVVSSATAPSAAQAVSSVLALGVSPQLLAASLAAVTCQRLVRTICRICQQPAEAPPPQILARHGLTRDDAANLKFFKGKGCPTCNGVGYRGRRAVFEVMSSTGDVRAAVADGRPPAEIEAAAILTGMVRMRERCLALVAEGVTTFDEFARLRL
jgi:type IV pilus assembly protein PilB